MTAYITPKPVYYAKQEEIQDAIEINAIALELTRLAPYCEQKIETISLNKKTMLTLITQFQENKNAAAKLQKTSLMPWNKILPDDVIREISKRCDKETKAQTLILTKKGLVSAGYSKEALKDALSDRKNPFNLKKIQEILEKHPDLMETQRSLSVVCTLNIPNTEAALRDLLMHKLKNITELFIENRQIWHWDWVRHYGRLSTKLEMENSSLKILSLSSNDFFNLENIPKSVEELTLTSYYIDSIKDSLENLWKTGLKIKKLTLGLTLNYKSKVTNEVRQLLAILINVVALKVMDVTYNLAVKDDGEPVQHWHEVSEYNIEQVALYIIKRDKDRLKPGQKITVNYDTTENGVETHKTISFTK